MIPYSLMIAISGTRIHQVSMKAVPSLGLDSEKTAVGNKSPQTNQLTIIVRNQYIFLYVNKKYVGSIKESYLTTGEIGFFAENGVNTTEVALSNTQVWQL